MGCINSKKELSEINPNIYRVVNVDDDGIALWSGQLEITRTELTLYRKGKEPTRWALKCLRRYGYDADLFTFEAGRRCTTGEGIYAFRCRRAESLFQTLQNYIQLPTSLDDGSIQDIFPIPIATNGPAVIPRNRASAQILLPSNSLSGNYVINNRPASQNLSPSGTIQSNSNRSRSTDTLNGEGNYLEPTPNRPTPVSRFHTGLRLGSVSSGPLSPDPHSPGSPNSITNILEVTTLNPLPISHPGISNLYQEFPLREHNNNSKKLSLDVPPQEPAPSLNLPNFKTPNAITSNGGICDEFRIQPQSPISIMLSDTFDSAHMYMNITPGEMQSVKTFTTTSDTPHIAQTPTTSATIFGLGRVNSIFSIDPNRSYENLEPGELRPLLLRNRFSKPDIFAKSELPSDKSEPCTPTNRRCNYIVLDLDQAPVNVLTTCATISTNIVNGTIGSIITSTNHSTGGIPTGLLPPESPKKGVLDYATIDFNKTVALSNSTTPSSELDSEGSRQTRHSSTVIIPTKHSNSISE